VARKQCRRVATRYDKLAANYLAFVKLASIRIWLRANESAPLEKGTGVLNFPRFLHTSRQVGRPARFLPYDGPGVNASDINETTILSDQAPTVRSACTLAKPFKKIGACRYCIAAFQRTWFDPSVLDSAEHRWSTE
jgi:hypothetical protein